MSPKEKASGSSGETRIAEDVMKNIAAIAARETPGVHRLGRGKMRSAFAKVTGSSGSVPGISVEVGSREVAIDMDIVVIFGHPIEDVAEGVRENVGKKILEMTGKEVKEININVVDIYFPEEPKKEERRVL